MVKMSYNDAQWTELRQMSRSSGGRRTRKGTKKEMGTEQGARRSKGEKCMERRLKNKEHRTRVDAR